MGLMQVVDALILYDTPILDQRFQEAITMHQDPAMRERLRKLPARVALGSRLTRRAGLEWERTTGGGVLDDEFKSRAARFLLEALLDSAEDQIRLKHFLARSAPTEEARRFIDEAILVHRELAGTLREAIKALPPAQPDKGDEPVPRQPQYISEEREATDLRGQVEGAIRAMVEGGKRPKALVVSDVALRHLRDQGLFHKGEATVLGVPVEVDFTWDGSKYALLSTDTVTLEEILRG